MWIVDDEVDASLGLPDGDRDIPLMICDRSLQAPTTSSPTRSAASAATRPTTASTGNYVLVNGAHLPRHRVEGRRHRLRILNASQFRSYNLALSNGAPMTQIATEGGLMPKPLKRKRILVGPGERVEVVVDFGDFPHRDVELVSVRRRDGETQPRLEGLRGAADAVPRRQARARPRRRARARCGRCPDWVSDAPAAPQHTWEIGIDGFQWVINGRTYDPGYADHHPVIDTTETWRLKNKTVGRAPDPPAPHRLVHARAQRQAPAAVGAMPEGDLLPRSQGRGGGRRALQRPPRQVRRALPHARSRGSRADVPVRSRPRLGDWRKPPTPAKNASGAAAMLGRWPQRPPMRTTLADHGFTPHRHGYGLLLILISISLIFQLATSDGEATHVVTILLAGRDLPRRAVDLAGAHPPLRVGSVIVVADHDRRRDHLRCRRHLNDTAARGSSA